jgi:hypothetical protein
MKQRIVTRETNDFGKSSDELALMLYWHDRILERYENLGATMLDATKPVENVVDEVLTISARA